MPSSPYISVCHLSKVYQRPIRGTGFGQALRSFISPKKETITALEDVSFEVHEGEFVGYLGPNGSGKSSTIKLLCGILTPTSGSCQVGGVVPWADRINHVKNLGVVFGQRTQLWWDIPVSDSFVLLRDMYQVPKNDFNSRLHTLVESLQVGSILSAQARTLSLGQRMRCELIASLLHNPRLLVLDEPTIGLDIAAKQATYAVLARWNQEYGTTVVLTTHDLTDVETLCKRVILISKGSILFDGDLSELRRSIGGHRRVKMELRTYAESFAGEGITVVKRSGTSIELDLDLSKTTVQAVLAECCATLPIEDISVQYPPLEEAVLPLYARTR